MTSYHNPMISDPAMMSLPRVGNRLETHLKNMRSRYFLDHETPRGETENIGNHHRSENDPCFFFEIFGGN